MRVAAELKAACMAGYAGKVARKTSMRRNAAVPGDEFSSLIENCSQ
jgi:hypothetical protein